MIKGLDKMLVGLSKKRIIVPCFQRTYEKFERMRSSDEDIMPGSFEEISYILKKAGNDETLMGLAKIEARHFVTGLTSVHNLNLGKEGFYVRFVSPHPDLSKQGLVSENMETGVENVLKGEVARTSHNRGVLSFQSLQHGILDYIRFAPWGDAYSVTSR